MVIFIGRPGMREGAGSVPRHAALRARAVPRCKPPPILRLPGAALSRAAHARAASQRTTLSMNRITGRNAFLALLQDEGVTHLFGNPGTTELPIMHALKDHPDLTYVMAMQECLVVAMADGFSRASGRLVACNVHVAPGLGNAMGSLYI